MLLVDEPGIWHPKMCGLACKVGQSLNIPTIGVTSLKKTPALSQEYNREFYEGAVSILS